MNRLILIGFDDARKFNFINEIVLIDNEYWEEVPQNQLIVYKDGKIVYEAEPHKNTYIHNEENMRFLYLDHATL